MKFCDGIHSYKEWTIDTTERIEKTRSSTKSKRATMTAMEGLTLARLVVAAAADKKAENIVLLDLRKISPVTDYFVICSGSVDRQLRAIAENILGVIKSKHKIAALHIEGSSENGWVLIDYGDVVIHLFTPTLRNYYNLETLWSGAPVLLRMQ